MVNPASTVTAVISSGNPSVYGQSVTLTAIVTAVSPSSGIPTGTVIFRDGTAVLRATTLDTSGRATFTTRSLRVGSHSITVAYQGNTDYTTSATAALIQTVPRASTTTVLVPPTANPSVRGRSVTFAVIVAPVAPGGGAPTGTVIFKDGSTVLGTRALDAHGVATLSTRSLRVGRHAISVLYRGDTSYAGSTSTPLIQTVRA
jgi:hypothetical protein